MSTSKVKNIRKRGRLRRRQLYNKNLSNDEIISKGGLRRLFKYKHIKNMKFVFWTGGYDSTFRLLQLLIILKKPVVAVYVSDPTTDSRQNTTYEIQAMNNIIKKVKRRFPFTRELFKEFIIIRQVPFRSRNLDRTFRELQKKYPEFYRRFEDGKIYYGQMEKLSIVSKRFKRPMDIGVIRNERDHEVYRNDYLMRYKSHRCTFSSKMPYLWRAFCWLRFPIAHITKEEMVLIAHQYYFSDILLFDTISCRWPKKRGRLPCKKCHMCKLRRKSFSNLLNIIRKPLKVQKPRYKKYFEMGESRIIKHGITTFINPLSDGMKETEKVIEQIQIQKIMKLKIPEDIFDIFKDEESAIPQSNSLESLQSMILRHLKPLKCPITIKSKSDKRKVANKKKRHKINTRL